MNIPAIKYEELPKIVRLSREVTISEKLDGTQGTIYVDEQGNVYAASKSRWITPENDNHGFARWVETNQDELKTLGEGFHRGEWFGLGIQRGYNLREKRFSLFNTLRWGNDRDLSKYPSPRPTCCHIVPVLYRGIFSTAKADEILEDLRLNGSKAVPGYNRPEGIVIFHIAGNIGFKKTLDGDGEKWKQGPE